MKLIPTFRDYVYFLSLQKCSKNSEYTIHGLWIDYKDGGYPQFCHNTPFIKEDLQPILKTLETNWHSCIHGKGKDNYSFWKHEFKKHATCFPTQLTELEYFSKTLELFQNKKDNNTFTQCHSKHDCMIEIKYNEIYNDDKVEDMNEL